MEFIDALKKETERANREYESLLEAHYKKCRELLKVAREINLINELLEYHGEKPIEFETN